jgi:hypothetical protein
MSWGGLAVGPDVIDAGPADSCIEQIVALRRSEAWNIQASHPSLRPPVHPKSLQLCLRL